MEVAWSTLLAIAVLLPGAAFFVGAFSKERLYREIVRASTVAEIGAALLVSLLAHLTIFYCARQVFNYHAREFLQPIFFADRLTENEFLASVADDLFSFSAYIAALSLAMYALGRAIAWAMAEGPLRGWATHQWVYDLRGGRGRGVVTTYIMTTTVVSEKVLMYEGQLSEIFLQPDGAISYLVLKDCSRYYMALDHRDTETGPRLNILRNVSLGDGDSASLLWNYFTITGDNIANVLFKKNPEVRIGRAEREVLARLDRLLADLPDNARVEG